MPNLPRHINDKWSTLEDKNLFLACSGGLDSIVLLHLLHNSGSPFSVIHVNYHLRGKDSNLDSEFVAQTCKSLGISFEIKEIDLAKKLEEGGNLQEKARDFRYQWFHEILNADQTNRILLAHHADDQVETFFLNLARKSGVMGLSCMKSEHNNIIRPLLDFTKKELILYAKENQILWREDESNTSNKYRRNRLRNEILPHIRTEISTLDTSVLTLISSFQQLQLELEEAVALLILEIENTHSISYISYNKLSSLERIELFRQLGVAAKTALRVEQLRTSAKGKRIEIDHPMYGSIIKDHDQFTFLTKSEFRSKLIQERATSLPKYFSKNEVYLDSTKLVGKLQIRRWKLEDRIAPIGMTGSQLISDIIKDAKLTAQQKQEVLVVHDEEHIHWCVGLKVGRLAIANHSTKEIVRYTISD